MKYLFTTLAVGDSYLNSSVEAYSKIARRTSKCDFNITTNINRSKIDRINFDNFTLDTYHGNKGGFSFFLSLKALALKYATKTNLYSYVVYTDADWEITEEFTEDKMLKVFNYMESNNYDALFERPAEIGYYKKNFEQCYFQEKLEDFNVLEHTLWDRAHCFNEQFMIFKVNWKFKLFVMKWEMFLWYSIANDLRSYPDGFDIGVSALEATMDYEFNNWRHILRDCFKFNNKENETYIRF